MEGSPTPSIPHPRKAAMKDIYLVSYRRADGEFFYTTVESHCRIAAINEAVLAEARCGHDIVCGVAEIMCPGNLLSGSTR